MCPPHAAGSVDDRVTDTIAAEEEPLQGSSTLPAMRILVITNMYPPHALGGYEDMCAGAVAAWRRAGHDVLVLTSGWRRDDVDGDDGPDGEDVLRELPCYLDGPYLLEPPLRTCLRWEMRTRRVVTSTVVRWRPDVASVWNAAALSFGIFDYLDRHDVPAVPVLGERWLSWAPRVDGWGRRFRRRRTRPLAAAIRAVTGLATRPRMGSSTVACFASHHLRDHALQHTQWPYRATPVVPHGLDLSRFSPRPVDRSQRWEGRLLYVGRIDHRKGIGTSLRALALLDDMHLDVVGAGDDKHLVELHQLADVLGVTDRVHWHGHCDDPQSLQEHYHRADAVLFPPEWDEPFGIVPLEAMRCRVPVVASGTGGSGEFLLPDRTCVRFRAGDAEDLARAVRRLADDPELRTHLVVTGEGLAEWLSRERTFDELEAWHAYAAGRITQRPPERPVLPAELEPADAPG